MLRPCQIKIIVFDTTLQKYWKVNVDDCFKTNMSKTASFIHADKGSKRTDNISVY